ncbi:MAG: hypothetical protein JRJ56_08330, partial [Deltaproteobacteria bacterium]|nr:hypothetical protein [Deltaproteobacteria bacterium]
MLQEIKEIWAAGRQSLIAALSPLALAAGWRPLFSTAYPGYEVDKKELEHQRLSLFTPAAEGKVLDLFQNFFDSLAEADDETLLPVCGQHLVQLAGARAVFFAVADGRQL